MLGTGWFGAVAAEAGPGKTVAVVGDGAVGLLAVLAAKQLGAERIIIFSRHEARQKLAREFGATDMIGERGDDGVAALKELLGGLYGERIVAAALLWTELPALMEVPPAALEAMERAIIGGQLALP